MYRWGDSLATSCTISIYFITLLRLFCNLFRGHFRLFKAINISFFSLKHACGTLYKYLRRYPKFYECIGKHYIHSQLSDNSSNKRSCMTHACEDSHNNDKSYIEHNNVPLESVERFKVFAIDVTPVPNHVWNECATHRLDVMEVGAMTCCAYDNTCKWEIKCWVLKKHFLACLWCQCIYDLQYVCDVGISKSTWKEF